LIFILIKNHSVIEDFLSKHKLEYVSGKTWTTDAFYKETEPEIRERRKEGCVTVEMACAGYHAVSDFYGWAFYEFFFGGDLLDSKIWEKGTLGNEEDKERHNDIFKLALELSLEI
jgi:purine-nucleoside phosphorylase